jgi:hypothetical protein
LFPHHMHRNILFSRYDAETRPVPDELQAGL